MSASRSITVRRPLAWACLWAATCVVPAAAVAVEPGEAAPATTFRRILVPAGDESQWPVGNQRYLAVEAAEFDRLHLTSRKAGDGRPNPPDSQLTAARYSARLEGNSLVAGTASWTFRSSPRSSLLELGHCGLAIRDIRWSNTEPETKDESTADSAVASEPATDSPISDAPPAAAVLGSQPTGALAVLLHGPGEMQCAWTLTGHAEQGGGRRFEINLPRSLVTSIELELPLDVTPLAEPGIVAAEGAVGASSRRWRIDLGSSAQTTLRIAPLEVLAERERLALVRQTLSYDLSLTGVELEAEFELDVHYQPLKRLELTIDPGIQLAAARYGETPLAWKTLPGTSDDESRVVVELPEPVLGEGRRLRISARGELVRGARWKLPSLRAKGVFWQEGRAAIRVGSPLVVMQLFTQRCRQTATAALPSPLVGESIEVQFFDPQAAIEVFVERRPETITVASGIRVDVSPSLMTAETIADFTVDEGERLEVTALLRQPWALASLESVPSEAVAEWSLEKQDPAGSQLRIRLAEALTPDRALRLKIRAECLRPPQQQVLQTTDLVPLEFQLVAPHREVLCVEAREGVGLRTSNDVHLTRLDPRQLEPRVAALFENPPPGLLFVNDDEAQALRIEPYDKPPRYAAETRIRVVADRDGIHENYRLRYQPDKDRVSKVYVRFSQEPEETSDPPTWRWGATEGEQLSAQRLTAEQCAALGWISAGETWELTLPQPQTNAFAIYTRRSRPWHGRLAVNLIAHPEAAFERARIELFAAADTSLDVLNRRLRDLPADPGADPDSAARRGLFRYDPEIDATPGGTAPLELELRDSATDQSRALIWTSELHSHYAESGQALHTAFFRVQNDGTRRLQIKLPARIEVQEVWVNDRRIARRLEAGNLIVLLPDRPRFVTIAINLLEPMDELSRDTDLTAPNIHIVGPRITTNHGWFVRLPAGYEVTEVSPTATLDGARRVGIAGRLFGPLAREDRHQQPGSLTRLFPGLAGHRDDGRQLIRERAERFLDTFGADPEQVKQHAAGQPVQLGAALASAATGLREVGLLVDRSALSRAGITPASPLRLDPSTTGSERGLSLLADHGLALVCEPHGMTLTSQAWWTANSEQLEIWHPSGWGSRDRHDERSAASEMPITANEWSAESQLPWNIGTEGYEGTRALSAWRTFQIRSSEPMAIIAHVEYVPRADFLAWCVGFVACGATWQRAAGGRRLFIWLLVCTAVALLVPDRWTTLASAVWLGAIGGALLRMLLPRTTPSVRPGTPSPSSEAGMIPVASVWLAALTLAAGMRGDAHAADDLLPGSRDDYRVFVPVDAEGKPTGDPYQVPEELYFQLQRAAATAANVPRGYLLTGARYSGSVTRDKPGAGCQLDRLQAVYTVDVLTAPARVEIPLDRDRADLMPGGVLLDGRAVPVSWSSDDRSLVFSVGEAGEHRIELALGVRLQINDDFRRLELAIPEIVESQLELNLPVDPPTIEVRGAAGPVQLSDEGLRLRVALGATRRLNIEWPEFAADGPGASEVEELVWLSVRPGSVTVDLRMKYRLAAPRVVRVATDPRLRLLGGPAARTVDAPARDEFDQLQWLEFDAVPNAAGEAVVSATFLVTGTSGVGKLRMPRFEPLAGRVIRRWLAYTIDPALESIESATTELTPVAVTEFVAAWGAAGASPNAAYLVPSNEVLWSLGTQPRETSTKASSRLQVTVGSARASIRFESRLDTTAGYVFQHTLRVPARFEVEHVSIWAENSERAARWTRHDKDQLSVFLAGPTTGKHRLEITGWAPLDADGSLQLPIIQLENLAADERELEIYRRPNVALMLQAVAGLSPVIDPPAELPADDSSARFVAQFVGLDGAEPSGTLMVTPNAPLVQSIEVTTISRNSDGWQAAFQSVLEISDGNLGELVLDAPPEWQGPFGCDPVWPVRALELPSAGRRRLLIRPQEPLQGRCQFSIVGASLRPTAEHGIEAPQITLSGTSSARRFLVLPLDHGRQRIDWSTRGLIPAQLPAEAAIDTPPNSAVYELLDDRGEAFLAGIGDEDPRLRVRLADYSVDFLAAGWCNGIALFDLEPAGQLKCPLVVPPHCELVQAFVDGSEANLLADGPDKWSIRLGPRSAPTRIQILFRTRSLTERSSPAGVRFSAPSLGSLAVEQTIWRVFSPPNRQLAPLAGVTLSPLQHALVRLRSTMRLADALDTLGEEGAPEEAARNFRPWARRLRAARCGVERVLSTIPAAQASRIREELAEIAIEQDELAQRLGAVEVLRQVVAEDFRADQPGQLWEDLAADRPASAICSFDESRHELSCGFRGNGFQQSLARWGLAGGCLLFVGLAWYAWPQQRWELPGELRPWVAIGVVGLLIWLAAADPTLGAGLLVIAVLGGILAAVRARSRGMASSTDFETAANLVTAGGRSSVSR